MKIFHRSRARPREHAARRSRNQKKSAPPLPCGVFEFTPQGKPSPLEGEGEGGGRLSILIILCVLPWPGTAVLSAVNLLFFIVVKKCLA